jgi:hypothetical protein
MAKFIEFFYHLRYHEAIRNMAPADMTCGRWEQLWKRRGKQKPHMLYERFYEQYEY